MHIIYWIKDIEYAFLNVALQLERWKGGKVGKPEKSAIWQFKSIFTKI
jgi:hypothetical protein